MKTFLNWMESEENPSLGEPQHKQGEGNLSLDGVVERRIKQVVSELQGSGKGSESEIMASVLKYLKGKGVVPEPKPPAGQPDQGMEINPVSQGRVTGNL